jgi:hypothetical protein
MLYSVMLCILLCVYTVNSSTGKLAALEMCGFFRYGRPSVPSEALPRDVWLGRISMCVMAVVGTLPLLQDPKVQLAELYRVSCLWVVWFRTLRREQC